VARDPSILLGMKVPDKLPGTFNLTKKAAFGNPFYISSLFFVLVNFHFKSSNAELLGCFTSFHPDVSAVSIALIHPIFNYINLIP